MVNFYVSEHTVLRYNSGPWTRLPRITTEEEDVLVDAIIQHSDKAVFGENPLTELLKDVDSLDRYLYGVKSEGAYLDRCSKVLRELGIAPKVDVPEDPQSEASGAAPSGKSPMSWRDDRIESAAQGLNPTVIARMTSGFAVIGDTQFLPGYCVLLSYPRVSSLNDLPAGERADFLLDMSFIGDAVMSVCKPLRVNYEILGNTDAFLHAHIFPRYAWEEESRRRSPVWQYPRDRWTLPEYQYNEARHGELKSRLAAALLRVMETHYR